MFSKISYTQKNKLLLPLALIMLLLCWFLAFSKTYQQISLHHMLQKQLSSTADIAFNPNHSHQKLQALTGIIKTYRVHTSEWSNQLWMKASAVAVKEKAGINYSMALPEAEANSTTLGETAQLHFYGNFIQLVRVIDGLEKTTGIGRISALQLKAPAETQGTEKLRQCVLQLEFKGLTNGY